MILTRNRRNLDGVLFARSTGMAGWKDFREISAWRLSRDVKLQVDVFLERPEVQRKFRFREQLSDAARLESRRLR